MSTPLPVVVAVAREADLTPALTFAVAEARRRGVGLELVHAYRCLPAEPDGPDDPGAGLRHVEHLATDLLRRARVEAERLADGEVAVTTAPRLGPVVPEVVAASEGASLVVLQRRDRGLLGRILTGSTTSGLAARAHAPVVAVPPGWTDEGHGVVGVAVDELDRSRPLLHRAVDEARARGAHLRVVHALWFAGGYDDVLVEQATDEQRRARARAELEAAVQEELSGGPAVPFDVEVRHARPADALVAVSRACDLLLLGRHDPLVPLGSHLGPVVRAVLQESACPVMVVAPRAQHRREHASD